MGRIPARFPANESALNLSRRASVATCDRFDLVSSLASMSGDDGAGETTPGAIIDTTVLLPTAPPSPAPITNTETGALRADEIGFSYGTGLNEPGSDDT